MYACVREKKAELMKKREETVKMKRKEEYREDTFFTNDNYTIVG